MSKREKGGEVVERIIEWLNVEALTGISVGVMTSAMSDAIHSWDSSLACFNQVNL
jgi:hypothetical protein